MQKIGGTPAGFPVSHLLRHKWSDPGWGHGTPGGCQRLRVRKTQLCLSALGWDAPALAFGRAPMTGEREGRGAGPGRGQEGHAPYSADSDTPRRRPLPGPRGPPRGENKCVRTATQRAEPAPRGSAERLLRRVPLAAFHTFALREGTAGLPTPRSRGRPAARWTLGRWREPRTRRERCSVAGVPGRRTSGRTGPPGVGHATRPLGVTGLGVTGPSPSCRVPREQGQKRAEGKAASPGPGTGPGAARELTQETRMR